jgi:hypothetical protein
MLERPECAWITREFEQQIQGNAAAKVVPTHLKEMRNTRLGLIA